MSERVTMRVARTFAALFNLIAEPRVTRVIQFVIYALLIVAGGRVLVDPPPSFEGALGVFFVYVFGGFVLAGGVIGSIAVLPGIWWLERSGLVALFVGLLFYAIVTVILGSSIVGTVVCLAFALTFVQRWRDIRGAALAPKGR